MLASLPLYGKAHAINLNSRGDQKRLDFLNKSLSVSKYATNKASNYRG